MPDPKRSVTLQPCHPNKKEKLETEEKNHDFETMMKVRTEPLKEKTLRRTIETGTESTGQEETSKPLRQ
ncbi:hypothetical protein [Gimesia panareensis]|uniref:hypothetical protein n=1 Tax=Gimesia panareensis TaxID=2527978 RepID=UPI0018D7F821|nr:hypothetical protein [Gimesia panareensis]